MPRGARRDTGDVMLFAAARPIDYAILITFAVLYAVLGAFVVALYRWLWNRPDRDSDDVL